MTILNSTALCVGCCPTAVLKSDALDPTGNVVRLLGQWCWAPLIFPSCFQFMWVTGGTIKIRRLMLRMVAGHSCSIWPAFKGLSCWQPPVACLGGGHFIPLGLRVLVYKIREFELTLCISGSSLWHQFPSQGFWNGSEEGKGLEEESGVQADLGRSWKKKFPEMRFPTPIICFFP